MHRSEVTPTLLSALLRNQIAIAEALQHLASMAECNGHETVALAVRERLKSIAKSEPIVGACAGALMQT